MKQAKVTGHICALVTILIWGTTFISTKVLLTSFSPIEILFIRFLIGFVVLVILFPQKLKLTEKHQERLFIGAGICGVFLYYLLENIALTMTSASNVGIILTLAPFFTGLLSNLFLKAKKPAWQFYLGFVVALIGVFLISYNGSSLELNPLGDLLALLAAILWAIYSILTNKIGALGFHSIQVTRRIFLWGVLFMLPVMFLMDVHIQPEQFLSLKNLGNLLFLGVGASALCFVTWNTSVAILGAIQTSAYIYLVPIVTLMTSAVVLKEALTPILILGACLAMAGMWLSETKLLSRRVKFDGKYKSKMRHGN